MSKPVLVDMDSILSDFLAGLVDLHNQETGDTATKEQVDIWDYKFRDGTDCLTYFKRPGFFRGLKPIPGAGAGLQAIMQKRDTLIVSSSLLSHGPAEKYEWLEEHLPFFPRKNVIFAARKEFVIGSVLIDDYPGNVEAYHRLNPETVFLTLKYSYNRDCGLYALRADTWEQIADHVLKLD